jgi:uncharacterized membrane protein
MATRLLTILLRTALVVAIVASTALFVDYQSASGGGFCADGASGCAQLRDSAFSRVGPVKMPTIGMIGFVGLFAFSLWASKERHFRLLAAAAGAGAAAALVLIVTQLFVEKTICAWCMAVDVSAIVAAAAAVALALRAPDAEPRALRMLWAAVGLAGVAIPLTWETAPPATDVPAAVAHYYAPDRVDVVMFTDFECPYCRRLHDVVDELMAEHPAVHLQRVMVPLPGHLGAEPSALGYLCAPQAAREALADALYHREPGPLSLAEVVDLAEPLGVPRGPFVACLKSDETRQRLEAEKDLFQQAALRGLPSTFVEQELVVGADEATLRGAVERALEGHSAEGGIDLRYMFALVALLVLAVSAVSLRASMTPQRERRPFRSGPR